MNSQTKWLSELNKLSLFYLSIQAVWHKTNHRSAMCFENALIKTPTKPIIPCEPDLWTLHTTPLATLYHAWIKLFLLHIWEVTDNQPGRLLLYRCSTVMVTLFSCNYSVAKWCSYCTFYKNPQSTVISLTWNKAMATKDSFILYTVSFCKFRIVI
jgi:hypothetical protein